MSKDRGDTSTGDRVVNPRLLILHLALAVVAVQLMSMDLKDYRWPRWQCVFIESVAACQVALVAVWLGMGNTSLALRATACLFVTASWLMILGYLVLDNELWPSVFAAQVSTIVGSLVAFRLTARMVKRRNIGQFGRLGGRAYFSTRSMLEWVMAWSCLMFLITVVRQELLDLDAFPRYGSASKSALIGLLLGIVALAAVGATRLSRHKYISLLVFVAVTVTAALLAGKLDTLIRRTWWSALPRESYAVAYWRFLGLYGFFLITHALAMRLLSKRLRVD